MHGPFFSSLVYDTLNFVLIFIRTFWPFLHFWPYGWSLWLQRGRQKFLTQKLFCLCFPKPTSKSLGMLLMRTEIDRMGSRPSTQIQDSLGLVSLCEITKNNVGQIGKRFKANWAKWWHIKKIKKNLVHYFCK